MRTLLSGKRIAILVEDDFHDPDVIVAMRRLRAAGASVTVVGNGTRHAYRGERGTTVVADCSVVGARPEDVDAVLIPGGQAPKRLCECPEVISLLRAAHAAGKVVAAFSQAAHLLLGGNMLTGRAATLDTGFLTANLDRLALVADGNVIAAADASSPEFYATLRRKLEQTGNSQPVGES